MDITVSSPTVGDFDFDNDIAAGAVIERHEGFEWSSVRHVLEEVPSRDGAIFIDSKFGARSFGWEGTFLSTTADEVLAMRRNFLKVCTQGELKTIKVNTYDGLALQINAIITKVLAPYTRGVQHYLVEALAADFRLYSQALQSQSTSPTTSTGGTAIPTPVPLSLAFTGGVPKLQIANNGNIYTPPVFRISGPGTNFVVQNLTTGEQFNLTITLNDGEYVDIDVLNRTVTKGTNQNVFGAFSGDWITLRPGNNQIHFNLTSGSGANTTLRVQWRHAYLGV